MIRRIAPRVLALAAIPLASLRAQDALPPQVAPSGRVTTACHGQRIDDIGDSGAAGDQRRSLVDEAIMDASRIITLCLSTRLAIKIVGVPSVCRYGSKRPAGKAGFGGVNPGTVEEA